MSTGTVQNASKTLYKNIQTGAIRQTFTADADLVAGDSVKVSGNGLVDKAGATDLAVGVVLVGGLDGETVTVLVSAYVADALCVATGGAITAGSLVTFTGSATNGVPNVAEAVAGDVVKGIVLSGGNTNTEIRVGIVNGFYALPAAP